MMGSLIIIEAENKEHPTIGTVPTNSGYAGHWDTYSSQFDWGSADSVSLNTNSTETYTEQPKVINGASDLMAAIFGDAGMHTRAAVSTNSLPLGVAVEVDAIFEIK